MKRAEFVSPLIERWGGAGGTLRSNPRPQKTTVCRTAQADTVCGRHKRSGVASYGMQHKRPQARVAPRARAACAVSKRTNAEVGSARRKSGRVTTQRFRNGANFSVRAVYGADTVYGRLVQ